MIVGGALTIRQYLVAGLLDELRITMTPVVLGAGEPLFECIGTPALTQVGSVSSGSVTHLRYRIEAQGTREDHGHLLGHVADGGRSRRRPMNRSVEGRSVLDARGR